MSAVEAIPLALTDEQVAGVVNRAGGGNPLATLLSGLDDPRQLDSALAEVDERGLSHSMVRALLVLSAIPPGGERELSAVAGLLEFSPSTTHRYLSTWVAVGLIGQNPYTRRYWRRGTSAIPSGETAQ
jgi:hypothetical protein